MARLLVALLFAGYVSCTGLQAEGAPTGVAADQSGRLTVDALPPNPEIPLPNPRIAAGSWASVLGQRPRLLGPAGYVQQMAKAKPELYREIRSSSILLSRGIAQAVEGVPREQREELVRAALSHVERGVTDIHQDTWEWLTDVALTFDLFHDDISAADRQKMIDWMNPHLEAYTDDESAFHNSTTAKMLCYLRIAYATWGENPRAKEFRDYAIHKLYEARLLPVLQEFGNGGGWTECGWYQRHSLWDLVHALELARRVEGYDGFAKAPRFFYQRLAYEMLQPYPENRPDGTERFAVEGDGSDRYWSGDEAPHLLRDMLAEYFRGSELSRYVANKPRVAEHPSAQPLEFLWGPPHDQQPLPIDGFPLAHLASGVGKVYARSDWSPDATWFRFECGDYWNNHQHYEVGNFEIFRHETLATESGEYYDYNSNHDVNWLIRTIAHNSMLIYQPDEQWTQMRDGGRNTSYNDGGQAKKWEWTVSDLDEWKSKRESFTRGRIVAYENTPEYTYVAADCTQAYAATKLESCIRQIVFIRPGTFVILDRVTSTKPEYKKTWLLHSRFEPTIDGRTFTIVNGAGHLTVQSLLPEQPEVKAVEGYTYGGHTFPPSGTRLSDTANKWRIEVSPSSPRKEDVFLHVMTTGDPRPSSPIYGNGSLGVRVGDAEIEFTGAVGATVKVGGRQFSLEPRVKKGRFE